MERKVIRLRFEDCTRVLVSMEDAIEGLRRKYHWNTPEGIRQFLMSGGSLSSTLFNYTLE